VISLFMALLSSRGISTPSLQARGEQRRFFYFNNDRDIPWVINKIFIYMIARSYIDNIAKVFNLDKNLAKAIALGTFLVSAYFISKTFSFSSANRRIGYFGIVFLLIVNSHDAMINCTVVPRLDH
jgi:hypothetical protein